MALPRRHPELPRQRRGTTPQGFGRYPDYDVLEQAEHWDRVTRDLVIGRLDAPAIRFFTPHEAATLGAFCDTVMAQDAEPRIPVLAFVDERLYEGRLDGYRYADMPKDPETWRLVARGLDEAAHAHDAPSYAEGTEEARHEICGRFARGELTGGVWDQLPIDHAWTVVMRFVLAAFYSHPWAWNEIGFGGPAYPRGYARMGIGLREDWEGEEAFTIDPVSDLRGRGVE